MSINKVILIGNCGKEPVIKVLANEVKVASFSIATTKSYKKQSGEYEKITTWHNITAWRGLAGVVEKYVHKGTQLYIEGEISNRSYDDKDGIKRYLTEIVALNITLLGKKSDSEGTTDEKPIDVNVDINIPSGAPSDDLPF